MSSALGLAFLLSLGASCVLALPSFAMAQNVRSTVPYRAADRPFIERLLSLRSMDLPTLMSEGLVEELSDGVYRFVEGRDFMPHEIKAARAVALATERPLLLFGALPGITEMRGVDAILFTKAGVPTHNVSMKAVFHNGAGRSPIEALEDRARLGKSGLKIVYNPESLHAEYQALEVVTVVQRLLGFNRGAFRPALILVDAIKQIDWEPSVRGERTRNGVEDLMRVTSALEGGAREMKLREFVDSLGTRVSDVWFLFPRALFAATRGGTRVFAVPEIESRVFELPRIAEFRASGRACTSIFWANPGR